MNPQDLPTFRPDALSYATFRPETFRLLSSDRRRRSWWWFDPNHTEKLSDKAFKWELIRRGKRYVQIWSCVKDAPEFFKSVRTDYVPVAAAARGLPAKASLVSPPPTPSPQQEADLAHYFNFMGFCHQSSLHRLAGFVRCDPAKTWIELTSEQQSAAELSTICPQLGDVQDVSPYPMAFGLVDVAWDAKGPNIKFVHGAVDEVLKLGDACRTVQFKRLHHTKKRRKERWVVIAFDARLSPNRTQMLFDRGACDFLGVRQIIKKRPKNERTLLLQELSRLGEEPMRTWEKFAENLRKKLYSKVREWRPDSYFLGKTYLTDRQIRERALVTPALEPHAAFLIPQTADILQVRRVFLDSFENKKKWFLHCEEFWESCRHEQKKRFPAWSQSTLPALSQSKPLGTAFRWFGIAAYDLSKEREMVRRAKVRQDQDALEIEWLHKNGREPRLREVATNNLKYLRGQIARNIAQLEELPLRSKS